MTVSCLLFWSSGIRNISFRVANANHLFRLNQVSREGRWGRIQEKMGYKANKANASTLKSHYEKILFPYDVFLSGVLAGDESVCYKELYLIR